MVEPCITVWPGSIPACAGGTLRVRVILRFVRVDPRVCGGDLERTTASLLA